MQTKRLLEEFPPVRIEAWEEAIFADLKGADYANKLIWQTPEGLAVKPYYRAEDIGGLQGLNASSESPARFGPRLNGDWRIREEIAAENPPAAIIAAQTAVVAGAEEIAFRKLVLHDASDLLLFFDGLPAIPLHFKEADKPLIQLLLDHAAGRPEGLTTSTGWYPMEDPDFAAAVLLAAPAGFVPFMIHGEDLDERGATAVHEVGFMLSAGIEFLREMRSREIETDRAACSVAFSFSIGASFFFQVAKLRAFRSLWAAVVRSFSGDGEKTQAKIYARTSRWNKTIYDPHVNILRAATETISAVVGGADSIWVAPFDECYKASDEVSRRLAMNTQLILKREAILGHVLDPGAGSYYLEAITDGLAREGWKLMQKVEAAGGYRKACADGLVDQAVGQSATRREKMVCSRRRVFTGTNQYANPEERVLDAIDRLGASDSRRGAEEYERLRLRTERHTIGTGKVPRVLLAEFGDGRMRAARSNFAANFFACAGFDIDARYLATAQEVEGCDADLIVLCSSDREYLAMANALAQRLKTLGHEIPLIVAGNPDSANELRGVGVADFIHTGSNPIELLTKWQRRLGIRG